MGENGKIERNKKQKEIKKDKGGGAVRFEKEKSDTVNKTRISDCSKERTNKKIWKKKTNKRRDNIKKRWNYEKENIQSGKKRWKKINERECYHVYIFH